MTGRHGTVRPLTPLQRAILDRLWRGGPATAEQVREALVPRHRLKDASVRTLLRRLESRGLVRHRVDGKVFVYQACAGSTTVAARTVRQIIRQYWAGSVEQFLAGIVDEDVVTAEELERLAKKVRSASGSRKPSES
ncbi:MAG: BlaI/MecI/CopY family transcriptional regulator [Vicinamibacterales bacterium]